MLVTLFLAMFALEAFSHERGVWASVPEFFVHLLPPLALVGVVLLAWRRPWLGAVVFLVLAAIYALVTLDHPRWIAAIAGPLGLVGLLYLLSWRASSAGS